MRSRARTCIDSDELCGRGVRGAVVSRRAFGRRAGLLARPGARDMDSTGSTEHLLSELSPATPAIHRVSGDVRRWAARSRTRSQSNADCGRADVTNDTKRNSWHGPDGWRMSPHAAHRTVNPTIPAWLGLARPGSAWLGAHARGEDGAPRGRTGMTPYAGRLL